MTLIDRGHAIHDGPYFPTFITHRSKTSPDIVLTNKQVYQNTFSEIGPLTSSDHIPIVYTISNNPIQIPILQRINFKKANWDRYRDNLSANPIVTFENKTKNEIEIETKKWTEQIQKASEENIPKTKHRTIPHFKTTHETRLLQIQHDAILQDILTYGPSLAKYKTLTELRNRLRHEYGQLKTQTWNDLIEKTDIETNSKDFWQSIKRMIGRTTTKEQKYLKGHNNEDIYDSDKKEELFRKYWETVFKISDEENADFDQETDETVRTLIRDNNSLKPLTKIETNRLIRETHPISTWELIASIKSFKQKSPGEDGLTKYHLINLPPNMIENFKNILNAALSIGHFPQIWKTSIMIFIPKPGKSPLQHTNYRPISLLSVPSKVFEKVLNRRLMTFLETNNLHNNRQHGFRPGRGTGTATALMYELIATGRANRLGMNVVLRDISRAFDKVWHDGLRYKLLIDHIPQYLCRILSSYLNNRSAKIRIDSFTGPSFPLTSGVPQGGCLSPTLFNHYTHDLPEPRSPSENLIYADDITQIVASPGKSEKMLALTTAREIKNINDFENKWKIKTNPTKFQIIPMGRHKTENIKIGNQTHILVSQGKALGVTITKTGFKQHLTNRIVLAKQNLKQIFRFRNLKLENKRKLYTALVKSTIEYPPIPNNTASKTTQTAMQRVQNKAARFITGCSLADRHRSTEINEWAGLKPLKQSLHEQATATWDKIETIMTDRLRARLTIDEGRRTIATMPSSRNLILD
jgi:hypothetical protein